MFLAAAVSVFAETAAQVPGASPFANVLAWIVANKAVLIPAVIAVLSEIMSLIPSLKSNGIIDLFINILKAILGKETAEQQ